MKKQMKRKEFLLEFLPYNQIGTQVWVLNKVKELPTEIVKMVKNLAELDFLKFISISDDTFSASSENYPNRPKVPVTRSRHETAIGIEILYSSKDKIIDFYDINSPIKGHGGKMVDAIFKDFPQDWQPAIIMDWSNGFWDKMKERHNKVEWLM